MAFFTSAITTLKTLVVAIGAGLGVWGVINLLEGYGNDPAEHPLSADVCGWHLPGIEKFFSKTVQFYDINYQLALNEDKTTIFENYCDFLNYFDSSISVQLSFINQQVDVAEFEKSIDIPDQNDDFNEIREEYRTMLKNQLSKGNNGLVKSKYITFGIEAESLKVARPRLERIEADILNLKSLGHRLIH